jgi:hypothetical protein
MINKKGEMTRDWVVGIVILLLLAAVVIYIFIIKPLGTADQQFSAQILKITNDACKLKGERAKAEGTEFTDKDGDCYPDVCDICLGGSNNQDKDLDGMPDDCDDDPDHAPKKGMTFKQVCEDGGKGDWNEDTKQCKLNTYDAMNKKCTS